MAGNQGGYWPTSWGWTSLALLFVALLVLVLGEPARPRAAELAFLGLLAAVLLWTALSGLWATSATQPLREAERTLVYVAAVACALVVVRSRTLHLLLGGVWAATVVVAGWGLLTRLVPDHFAVVDQLAGNRLDRPIGYWNALGLFCAMGALLACVLACRAGRAAARTAAAASLLVLVPVLYFTFSRGAWIALAVGLAAAVGLDRRRLQLVASLALVAPWPALGVLLASREPVLTHRNATIQAAAPEGHRLVWVFALLALGAAGSALLAGALGRRLHVSERARAAGGAALGAAALAGAVAVFAVYGAPWSIARRAYDAFASPPHETTSLNARLFNFSGSGRIVQWRVGWREARDHPWLGTGAGTYERSWYRLRPVDGAIRDAHSLYLETLAELGPVGLALLVAMLLAPLAVVRRARHHPLAPGATGAYVAYLVHAGVDWDWEIPAVTLAALLCGVAVAVAARRRAAPPIGLRLRLGALAALLALAAFAFVGLQGNRAVAASGAAAGEQRWAKAEAEARTAAAWAPWSAQPWQLLGEAQYGAGDLAAARRSFRTALRDDPGDWQLWLDLALASSGAQRRDAFAQARKLNPRGSDVVQLERARPSAGGA